MVSLYTQYRKHFKGPSWDDFAVSEYNRKRDYRVGRRSVEHQHQPWEWDDSSESENSDADSETNRPISEKTKADILHHREEISKKNDRDRRLAGKSTCKIEKPLPKQAWVPQQLAKPDGHVNQKATQTSHRKHRRSKRKRAGKNKAEVERKNLVNNRERQHERVPFVSYGWANDAPIEKKFTHNVRAAPKDVYPASLRALKRRELDIHKRSEENKRKTLLEHEEMKEKFFNLSHISPMFMTEYQRSYCNMDSGKTGYVW